MPSGSNRVLGAQGVTVVRHPIGTAAMMSRDLGGVVDSRNRVYGVNGLRVVDGSILPFQVSSHLMSVLYGLVSPISSPFGFDR